MRLAGWGIDLAVIGALLEQKSHLRVLGGIFSGRSMKDQEFQELLKAMTAKQLDCFILQLADAGLIQRVPYPTNPVSVRLGASEKPLEV